MRRTTRQSSAAASASGSQDSARSAPATEAVRKSGPRRAQRSGRECGADSKGAPPIDVLEKSAGDAGTAPSAYFFSPALQANLFPMLHSLDLCRLSLTCKSLRSILASPEFAARVVVDVAAKAARTAKPVVVDLGGPRRPKKQRGKTAVRKPPKSKKSPRRPASATSKNRIDQGAAGRLIQAALR